MTYSPKCIQYGYDGHKTEKGNWTHCSCGHIAQEHSKEGWCEKCNPSLVYIQMQFEKGAQTRIK